MQYPKSVPRAEISRAVNKIASKITSFQKALTREQKGMAMEKKNPSNRSN